LRFTRLRRSSVDVPFRLGIALLELGTRLKKLARDARRFVKNGIAIAQ
jgi:hypothetical protein